MNFILINFFAFTFFGLFLSSPVSWDGIESTDLSLKEEPDYRTNACEGKPVCNLTDVLPEKGFYKCMCDSNCSFYGDCCSDSLYYNTSQRSNMSQRFSCHEEFRFYIINMCAPEFTDVNVKIKCENFSLGDQHEDAKIMKPLVDTVSRIIYWNAYCALCNNVPIANLETFHLSYKCFNTNTYTSVRDLDHLTNVLVKAKFNYQTNRFTSIYNDEEYICSHKVIIPTQLKPFLRYCEPKLISSCPKTFGNWSIIEKCDTSTYVVYSSKIMGKGRVYKNEYCALCNGITDTDDLHHCQNLHSRIGVFSLWNSFSTSAFASCNDPRLSHLC